MSKKKNRPAPPSSLPPSVTAIAPPPAVTSITATPPPAPSSVVLEGVKPAEGSFLATPTGRFFHRIFRIFSSLQLAITLLSIFTLCLIAATLIESRHSAEMAQQLVYRAWWFILLLFGLGANILCAALKKMDPQKLAQLHWPWKKYQTGFLVTHLGLITLVFGGLLTALAGREGQVQVCDAKAAVSILDEHDKDPASRAAKEKMSVREFTGYDNTSSTLLLTDEQTLTITRVPLKGKQHMEQASRDVEQAAAGKALEDDFVKRGGQQWNHTVRPGWFNWYPTDSYRSNDPWTLRLLRAMASPFPAQSFSAGEARVKLTNYFPLSEAWPFQAPTTKGSQQTAFPAVELRVESKLFAPADLWVTGVAAELPPDPSAQGLAFAIHVRDFVKGTRHLREGSLGQMIRPSVGFEFMTAVAPEQVQEFLQPPPVSEMGPQGQLVLFLEGQPHRIRLSKEDIGKPQKLGSTGLTLTVKQVGENLPDVLSYPSDEARELAQGTIAREGLGSYPFVRFALASGSKEGEYWACSRLPNLPVYRDKDPGVAQFTVFHHSPEGLFGRDKLHGSVQFLRGPEGKTYFRSYNLAGNLCGPGEAIDLNDQETRQGLPWPEVRQTSFRSIGYLPLAVSGSTIQPRHLDRVGARPPRDRTDLRSTYVPALIGVVAVDGKELPFQVRLGESARVANLDGGAHVLYVIRYTTAAMKLPFEITLHRTWDEKDPGTERSGKYHSKITISTTPASGKSHSEDAELYMNHTHDFGGYRFFQAHFEQTDVVYRDTDLNMVRKVNVSGITLAADPGLLFKYGGTLIVVLGIFIMFYMKAYFFKPRGRAVAARPAGPAN